MTKTKWIILCAIVAVGCWYAAEKAMWEHNYEQNAVHMRRIPPGSILRYRGIDPPVLDNIVEAKILSSTKDSALVISRYDGSDSIVFYLNQCNANEIRLSINLLEHKHNDYIFGTSLGIGNRGISYRPSMKGLVTIQTGTASVPGISLWLDSRVDYIGTAFQISCGGEPVFTLRSSIMSTISAGYFKDDLGCFIRLGLRPLRES